MYWMIIKNVLLSSTQVLKGDIREAICTHALYYAIWKKYEAMPERFNWQTKQSEVHFSPLRPELIESTYLLHQVRCLINRRSRRRGGLMVSALDFGWRGLGPSPGRFGKITLLSPRLFPPRNVLHTWSICLFVTGHPSPVLPPCWQRNYEGHRKTQQSKVRVCDVVGVCLFVYLVSSWSPECGSVFGWNWQVLRDESVVLKRYFKLLLRENLKEQYFLNIAAIFKK